MKIPKQLKIGGHIVKIIINQELDGKNGETNWKNNEIKICKTIPQSQKEATLIHEIFHILNTTIGENPDHHALIDSLSEQIYQVLSDNKLLK